MKPCIKVAVPSGTREVYLLNAGEVFPGFGGSRGGLQVRNTASLIIRAQDKDGMRHDTEYEINDADVWAAIARWIDNPQVTVVMPLAPETSP